MTGGGLEGPAALSGGSFLIVLLATRHFYRRESRHHGAGYGFMIRPQAGKTCRGMRELTPGQDYSFAEICSRVG